jgi:hypothetical protein
LKLYQSLSCTYIDDINEDIKIWIDKNVVCQKFWNFIDAVKFMHENPKFKSWCRLNNLKIRSIAVTWAEHQHCCGPHIDTPPARYKLSWPVHNTKFTWNRWFEAKSNAVTEINDLGGRSFINYDDLIEIGRKEVTGPALIDAGIIHDVWCEPCANFPRIGLQCQIFNESQFFMKDSQ